MWETIKKDPLIKTFVVILLGILAVGFAWHIMFEAGSGSMEEGSMMGSGNSLNGILGTIIALLVKIVIIGLLIGFILWIYRVITKQSVPGQTNRFTWLKEDPIIQKSMIIIGTVLLFVVGYSFLRSHSSSGNSMEDTMNSGLGYSFYPLLTFLFQVIILLLILSLLYGLIMYFRETYKDTLSSKNNKTEEVTTVECPNCKAHIKGIWKCCPYCGSVKAYENITD